MAKYHKFTHDEIIQILSYDENTGIFIWKKIKQKSKLGTQAGTLDKDGYRIIRIKRKAIKAHQLAWFYHYKTWANSIIDHINTIKDDNSILNLRKADNSQNKANAFKLSTNTSGYKGVHFHKNNKRWEVSITVNKKKLFIGGFNQKEEAARAYDQAAIKYFGEFARTNY